MAVGDEVAQALEAQIREGIERMVGDIRSTIQDIREAVDQQFDAALQSVQADANAMTFRSSIQKQLASFEESLTPAEAAAPAAPPAPAGEEASRIRESLQAIERGKSQVDVLNALLDECLHYGSRAALLILKGDTFAGWKGAGFTALGGNDEAVKRFTAAPQTIPELDQVLSAERVVEWDGGNVAARLGVTPSSRAVAIPMVIKDKVSAAMYVDLVGDDASHFNPSALAVLVFTTGLLIDTLSIRKKTPSPALNVGGAETMIAGPRSVPSPALPPQPQAAPRPATPVAPATPRSSGGETSGSFRRNAAGDISAVRRPAPAVPPPPPAPEAPAAFRPTFQLDTDVQPTPPAKPAPPPPPPPASAPLATTAIPAMRDETASGPRPAVRPAPAAPPTGGAFGETADRPSTQYIPPPGVARGGAFGGAQTDEARKHDEARRFARLLVSEIKLYNEAKVEQGRKNRDLYERLKEDIDRSRQMYDERIGEEIRKQSNYFYEELVRILADGDTDALGL